MRRFITLLLFVFVSLAAVAQMPGGEPIVVSNEMMMMNGNCYIIHVVQRGQTVYSITRAYGLKEYDAVLKKDVHFLSIGDTVWLPCKEKTPTPAQWKQINAERKNAARRAEEAKRAEKQRIKDSIRNAHNPKPATKTVVGGNNTTYTVSTKPAATAKPAAKSKQTKSKSKKKTHHADTLLQHYRERVDSMRVVVTVMMPLHLDEADEVLTATLDEKGKPTAKSLEFIHFYEGILLAADRLETQGIKVTLNVVDVPGNDAASVDRLFKSHNVEHSDFIIALLTREPFERAAQLAKQHRMPIVNPLSSRDDILDSNIYVYKCQPSMQSRIRQMVNRTMAHRSGAHYVLLTSGSKNEKGYVDYTTHLLDSLAGGSYTLAQWTDDYSFAALQNKYKNLVVVSYYMQGYAKNRLLCLSLLNKLSAFKSNTPMLVTYEDWSKLFFDVDFAQLQATSFCTFFGGWNSANPNHTSFIEQFAERFKTQPSEQYAALGHDVMFFFATGVGRHGRAFWVDPTLSKLDGMLRPMSFRQKGKGCGFENVKASLFKLGTDYTFTEM